jgi:hypothetical protein
MTDHPAKIAAKNSWRPNVAAKLSGLTVNQCRAIWAKQSARHGHRQFLDPLEMNRRTRLYRTRSAIMFATIEQAERDNSRWDKEHYEERHQAELAGIRATMILVPRAAKALGLIWRKSTNRSKRVSSYYVGSGIRISDHEIPTTAKREFMAQVHGHNYYDGYHGAEIIIDRPRSYTWLLRAILLAANGRSVP